MPQIISKIGIKNSSGTGFDTRDIGAKGQNVAVGYDKSGKVILNVDTTVPTTTKTVAEVAKSLEEDISNLDNDKAPIDHKWTDSDGVDYGKADGTHYGHIKTGTGLTNINGVVGVDYGSSAGTACVGNDSRLTNARKNPKAVTFTGGASDVVYDGSTAQTISATTIGAAPAGHISTPASTTTLGHVKIGTGIDVSTGTISTKYGTTAGTACVGNDSRLTNARTPVSHAASTPIYGIGGRQFGHVQLSDEYDSNYPNSDVYGADSGRGASAFALQQAYKNLKHNIVEYRDITDEFDSGFFTANPANYSPGNYIVKTYSSVTYVAVLCHYNYWYNPGSNESANINSPHWAAIVLGFTAGIQNSTNTTANGFLGSAMYTWLKNTAGPTVQKTFGSSHVKGHYCLLSTGTYNSSSFPSYGFSWGWTSNIIYAMIPSLAQLGCNSQISFEKNGQGEACRPLKLFQEESYMSVLGRDYGQSNNNFNASSGWCRDIAASTPGTRFCVVDHLGGAGRGDASASYGRFPLIILA